MFMTDAAAAPTATTQPSRAWTPALVARLRQPDATTDLTATTLPFGTRDIALILAGIARGLQRASALEERLARNAATSVAPKPPRAPRSQPAPQPGSRLGDLPTAEEIAADA